MSLWQCVRLTPYCTRLGNRARLRCHSYYQPAETVGVGQSYPAEQAEIRSALALRKLSSNFAVAYRGARCISACIFYCL